MPTARHCSRTFRRRYAPERFSPAGVLSTFERTYPFAWLGILAAAREFSSSLRGALHVMHANYPSIAGLGPAVHPHEVLLEFLEQAVAIEHRVNGAFGGNPNITAQSTHQELANLARTFVGHA